LVLRTENGRCDNQIPESILSRHCHLYTTVLWDHTLVEVNEGLSFQFLFHFSAPAPYESLPSTLCSHHTLEPALLPIPAIAKPVKYLRDPMLTRSRMPCCVTGRNSNPQSCAIEQLRIHVRPAANFRACWDPCSLRFPGFSFYSIFTEFACDCGEP